ncbi:MAG: hypothetical protein B7Z23_05645, partial [Pseudomonadales bacterium 32-61-5]
MTEHAQKVPARDFIAELSSDAGQRGVLVQDHQGRTCIQSTPPIVRTRMVPEPWHTSVLQL